MSLRPGARWSPQTQGIAGGIGSAFAGVSDQIRRVMQDRPASTPPSMSTGAVSTWTSGTVSLVASGTHMSAQITVPGAVVAGKTVAWYEVGFSANAPGLRGFAFTADTSLPGGATGAVSLDGSGSGGFVRPAETAELSLVVGFDGGGSPSGVAAFQVVAW